MIGLYVSYDEEKYGSINDLITISNDEYLVFEFKSPCRQSLKFPTKILIRVKKKGNFYKGNLLLVGKYTEFSIKMFENPKHRPKNWVEMNKYDKWGAQSVFFISNLRPIQEPLDITRQHQHPPQKFYYVEFN